VQRRIAQKTGVGSTHLRFSSVARKRASSEAVHHATQRVDAQPDRNCSGCICRARTSGATLHRKDAAPRAMNVRRLGPVEIVVVQR